MTNFLKGDYIFFNETGGVTDVGRVVSAGPRQVVVEQWHSDTGARARVFVSDIIRHASKEEIHEYLCRKQNHFRKLIDLYTHEADELGLLIELYNK